LEFQDVSDVLPCYTENRLKAGVLNTSQRWPESHFQNPTPFLLWKFWIRIRVRLRILFKFENPNPVQTPATIDRRRNRNSAKFLLKKWHL